MEVEINKLTNEEIARVFAMYLGCNFWLCDNLEGNPVIEKVTSAVISEIEKGDWLGYDNIPGELLLLTPLELISKEHAIEVAKILTPHRGTGNKIYKMIRGNNIVEIEIWDDFTSFKDGTQEFWCSVNILNLTIVPRGLNKDAMNASLSVQYLIQQGYAVPLFFGVNHRANGKTAIELKIAIPNPSI